MESVPSPRVGTSLERSPASGLFLETSQSIQKNTITIATTLDISLSDNFGPEPMRRHWACCHSSFRPTLDYQSGSKARRACDLIVRRIAQDQSHVLPTQCRGVIHQLQKLSAAWPIASARENHGSPGCCSSCGMKLGPRLLGTQGMAWCGLVPDVTRPMMPTWPQFAPLAMRHEKRQRVRLDAVKLRKHVFLC